MSGKKIWIREEKGLLPRDSGSRPAVGEILPRPDPFQAVVLAEFFHRGFSMLAHGFLRSGAGSSGVLGAESSRLVPCYPDGELGATRLARDAAIVDAAHERARADEAEARLHELQVSSNGEFLVAGFAVRLSGCFLTRAITVPPAWRRKVAAASDRVAEMKEDLLDAKEELAELHVVARGLGDHIFRPSWGDSDELMERLHAAPQRVDKLISDRFLGTHRALVATVSHYDNVRLEVVGSGYNPARCKGELLELGTAAELHAFLLAEEILPVVAINHRIS
ncbi:hypothetical protein C2845_PM02G15440 [Panicum miliaceum]|uniref:Uncharacterized protein n=1 Tax=Panicum miliaceum TaxID=4540 RepID=A0A3L6SDV5_PANMI|nr:hypothetical protein C2845_PM02G15440 [Panicum miliaceum]